MFLNNLVMFSLWFLHCICFWGWSRGPGCSENRASLDTKHGRLAHGAQGYLGACYCWKPHPSVSLQTCPLAQCKQPPATLTCALEQVSHCFSHSELWKWPFLFILHVRGFLPIFIFHWFLCEFTILIWPKASETGINTKNGRSLWSWNDERRHGQGSIFMHLFMNLPILKKGLRQLIEIV